MFAGDVTKEIGVPQKKGDPVSVLIRKLSYRTLEVAAVKKQVDAAESSKRWGAEMIRAFAEAAKKVDAADAPEPTTQEKRDTRYNLYDVEHTLRNGIKSWTAQRTLSNEAIDELTKEEAEFIFKEIIDLSDPEASRLAEAEGKS